MMDILPLSTRNGHRTAPEDKLRPAVVLVALYFAASPLSIINIGGIGAAVKIFAILALLATLLDIRKFKITICPLVAVLLLFWLLALISCFYTSSVSLTIQYTMTLTMNTMLVLVLGMMENYDEKDCALLEKAILIGSWVAIILTTLFSDVSAAGRLTMRIGNSDADQNGLTGFFLIAFSFHLCMFFRGGRKIHLLIAAIPLLFCVLTGSRGGILSFLIVTAAVFFLYRKKILRTHVLNTVAVVLALLLVLFIIIKLTPENVLRRYTASYLLQHGSAGRLKTWKALLVHYKTDNIFHLLFGHGYGTTRLYNMYNGNVAHNLYIDNLISLGLVGSLLTIIQQAIVLGILVSKRRTELAVTYIGYIVLCFSLSLTSYLPMWNIVLLTLIFDTNCSVSKLTEEGKNDRQ